MFGTIRRHSKWMWFIIVAVIIVSFVIYFDPSVQMGASRGGDNGQLGAINGKPITAQQFRDTQREVRLIYFLNNRKWPEQDETALQRGFDLERQTYGRLLQLAEVEKAGIQVDDTVVAQAARRMLGPELSLDRFANEVLRTGGATADDFARFLRHDLAIQQLSALQGLTGRLIPPAEAEAIYRREKQELAGEMVLFDMTNYMSRVAITNGALTNYFNSQMARYRTPEKLTISYVEFPSSNFFAQAEQQIATVTNLNAELERIYYTTGTNTFRDTNGNVLPREQALVQIRENEKGKLAMFFARRRANEFASKVYDEAARQGDNAPIRPVLLDNVAAAEGLPVQVSTPFSVQEGPTSPNLVEASPRLWMNLSETNAVVFQPLEGEDAYYVVAFKGLEPSRLQSFTEVQDQVAEDYRRGQAFTLIRNDATNFLARLTNGLATGRTFDEVATELSLQPITLPPISRSTEAVPNVDVNVDQLRRVMFSLEPGKASPMIPGQNGAYIVFVRAKLPLDEAKMAAELPRFMAELRYDMQSEMYNQWFRRQVEQAAPAIPALNQPPPQQGGLPRG